MVYPVERGGGAEEVPGLHSTSTNVLPGSDGVDEALGSVEQV